MLQLALLKYMKMLVDTASVDDIKIFEEQVDIELNIFYSEVYYLILLNVYGTFRYLNMENIFVILVKKKWTP